MRNLIRALIAALSLATLPVVSDAGVFVGVSVNIAPPELPVYVQPPCPAAGYIWIPATGRGLTRTTTGYPEPGHWRPRWACCGRPDTGLGERRVCLERRYWGRHVGFYGGVNYGFGYFGDGYEGGRWRGDRFYYTAL